MTGQHGERSSVGRPRSTVVIALSDSAFHVTLVVLSAAYVLLVGLLITADVAYLFGSTDSGVSGFWTANPILAALRKPEIQYSIVLSLVSCTMSAILSLIVAVPIGYLLSRRMFRFRNLIDAMLDIPIVLPPLVVGLSLLILFQFWPLTASLGSLIGSEASWAKRSLSTLVVYQLPAVVLAQLVVAAAFAVRTMRATFDQMDLRCEQVALTLGSSRIQAFGRVVLPAARRGMLTAFTLAWARSLGEFGPLLVFAGATRNKTEVLSTTVFLELSVGDLEAAVAVSLIMIVAAVIVLVVTRVWGSRELSL